MKILILGICCLSGIGLTYGETTNETASYDDEDIPTRECSRKRRCTDPLKYCNKGKCICKEIYATNEFGACICSNELGVTCKACCEDNACYEEDESIYVCQSPKMSFITASQIALCAAMLLGIVALSTLLWRICTKPEYLARRNRPNQSGNTTNDANRSISRISLSSVQIRILSRLRDRPPRYETNNNYEYQQSEAVAQTIPVARPLGEAPPAYDGSRNSISDRPPPYTVIITSEQGVTNEGFVVEEEIVVNNCDEVLKITTETGKNNSDKEIHI